MGGARGAGRGDRQNKAHLHYMGSGQGMDPENRKARLSIASDFSGTAHSFQGANLEAVIADCNDWSAMPSRKDQLTAYMCLNRIESADALRIVQPFSPQLFRQGDLPGPNFFLKFWQKEMTSEDLLAVADLPEAKEYGADLGHEDPRQHVGEHLAALLVVCEFDFVVDESMDKLLAEGHVLEVDARVLHLAVARSPLMFSTVYELLIY